MEFGNENSSEEPSVLVEDSTVNFPHDAELHELKLELSLNFLQLSEKLSASIEAQMRSLQMQLKSELLDELKGQLGSVESSNSQNFPPKEKSGSRVKQKTSAAKLEETGNSTYTLDTVDLRRHLDKICSRKLEQSVWSLPLFVFLGHRTEKGRRYLDHLLALWCIILNIIVQTLFAIIVQVEFTQTLPDLEAAQTWRSHVGHWHQYADSQGVSMVQRLCSRDLSLEISAGQRYMLQTVSSYVDTLGVILVGPVLSCMCLLVWFMSQMRDILSAFDEIMCLCWLPRTRETVVLTTPDGFSLKSISRWRLGLALSVAFTRLGLNIILSYSGTLWLASTQNVEEMLLNAVALEFILNIDEMIYECMVPIYIKTGAENLEPLHLPFDSSRESHEIVNSVSKHMRFAIASRIIPIASKLISFPARSALTIVSAAAYTAFFWHTELSQQLEEALSVKDALCSGPKDFVVGTHSATGIVLVLHKGANLSPSNVSVMQKVTRNLINGIDRGYGMRMDTWDYFQEVSKMSLDKYVARFGECKDFDPHTKYILEPLREAVADFRISSCDELSMEMCFNAPIVRFACPVTCGCSTPLQGNYILEGCPFTQCSLLTEYEESRRGLPTENIHPDVLSGSPVWRSYWSSYAERSRFSVHDMKLGLNKDEVRQAFLDFGCGAYWRIAANASSKADVFFRYFCYFEDNLLRRPLSVFCPETCLCNAEVACSLFCPPRLHSNPRLRCDSVEVWRASMAGCRGLFPTESNPNGVYKCAPYGYNGKHKYDYRDPVGMTWTIRWESAENMDFAAIFVHGNINANGSSKWTLTSRWTGSIEQRSVHSFVISNESRPPQDGWASPSMPGKHCSVGALQVIGELPRLILTAVMRIALKGQKIRGVELFVLRDIADLSRYGLGVANNGAVDKEEFTFPPQQSGRAFFFKKKVPAGTFIYLSRATNDTFRDVTGKDTLYDSQAWINWNGNDGVVVFFDGVAYDRYGVAETDGYGKDWEYTTHQVMYRKSESLPTDNFSMDEWIIADNSSILGSFRTLQ